MTRVPVVEEASPSRLGAALADSVEVLAEQLAAEMAAAWRQGKCPPAEIFLARDRALCGHAEAPLRIIYEEICLREELGQETAPEEFLERFPRWRASVEKLLAYHAALKPQTPATQFPAVGEVLGDFELLAELNRGAVGRVFVSLQRSLGDRPVVLKLTPCDGHEHLALARLQHTHIIPLNGVQDFPARGLRVLCMPYLGGTTLDRLLESLRDQPAGTRAGRHVLDGLDRARDASPVKLPASEPFRPFLARATFAEAVCWFGACLADALEYAHERGLVHLDVKPSNVLLAADGQPLLLDFHLAHEPILPNGQFSSRIGGTPAYMSPEQSRALDALRAGRAVAEAIDGRSDIYSLGLVLYESLGGALPATPEHVARWPRSNAQVSDGLAAILGKCLAADPNRRYASGAALAADLRRHLADRPLQGVANRSLVERWRKLRRRQPHLPAVAGMLLAVIAAALIVGVNTVTHLTERRHAAQAMLADGREQLRRGLYDEAARVLSRGAALAEGLPAGRSLADTLAAEVRRARRAVIAHRVHALADRVRFLYATDGVPAESLRAVEERCREIWGVRRHLIERAGAELAPDLERRLEADLAELVALWADLHARLASDDERSRAHHEALRLLDEAESQLEPSALLCLERRAHAEALGLSHLARVAERRAAALAPDGADPATAGLALFRAGAYDRAAAEFQRALDQRPDDFWSNFYAGTCAFRLAHYADAASAFRICNALAPESAECAYNLARARQALGDAAGALRAYDRALRLDPSMGAAYLNRGILHHQQKREREALADLEHARKLGADPGIVHYNLALVEFSRGNHPAARENAEQTLRADPAHQQARALLARLHSEDADTN